MLTEKELDLVTMELETVNLDSDVYRQNTKWGIAIVYYMLDLMLIEQGIIEPLHFPKDGFDSYLGKWSREELFEKVLDNTVNIFKLSCSCFHFWHGYICRIVKIQIHI